MSYFKFEQGQASLQIHSEPLKGINIAKRQTYYISREQEKAQKFHERTNTREFSHDPC